MSDASRKVRSLGQIVGWPGRLFRQGGRADVCVEVPSVHSIGPHLLDHDACAMQPEGVQQRADGFQVVQLQCSIYRQDHSPVAAKLQIPCSLQYEVCICMLKIPFFNLNCTELQYATPKYAVQGVEGKTQDADHLLSKLTATATITPAATPSQPPSPREVWSPVPKMNGVTLSSARVTMSNRALNA